MGTLFTQTLGLPVPRQVVDVDFRADQGRIVFQVACKATRLACPACGAARDCHHTSYVGAPEGARAWTENCHEQPDGQVLWVLRGGYWGSDGRLNRSAYRDFVTADGRAGGVIGLRVVRQP